MSEELISEVESFMEDYNVPGVQIAIMEDEEIVLNESFGYADTEEEIELNNDHVFRIASITKPITALGILTLIENEDLSLEDTIFGENGVFEGEYDGDFADDRMLDITISHLLSHTSGWVNEPNDPLFYKPFEFNHTDLIQYMLNRPLKYNPGEEKYYSNFGYLLLGRVIEYISDMSYEDYIWEAILEPCGVSEMYIGASNQEDFGENEVLYYNQGENLDPLSELDLPRLDSVGGWVTNASDLLKIMAKIDSNPQKEDILDEETLGEMYLGWKSWVHTGSLPGTSTLLCKHNEKHSFAILTNTRNLKKPLYEEMKKICINEINRL